MSKKQRPHLQEIGDQIAKWRRAKKLTQSELESRAGLAHNALSRIENGQVSPRLATIEVIAGALKLSFEELQFRQPAELQSGVREDSTEYLVNRLNTLDSGQRDSFLSAFHTLLDQVEKDK